MRKVPKLREKKFIPDIFEDFRERVNTLFEDFLGEEDPGSLHKRDFTPSINLKEDDDKIYVEVEIPGVDKKDVEISFDHGMLNIKGEKKEEREEGDRKKTFMKESFYGMFQRSIPLNAEVNPDRAKASFKKGVLKIELPKTEEAKNVKKIIVE
jgi:HSP20 family protein